MAKIQDPPELEALLRAAVGGRVRIEGCRVVNEAPDYRVLILRTLHPQLELVVKLAGPATKMACRFDRTAALNSRIAQETSIPMPDVIAFDASSQDWPWHYLIYTYRPGKLWRGLRGCLKGSELAQAYRQIGEAVGQLHGIGFPAFGEIDGDGQVQPAKISCLEALQRHAARIIPTPRLREAFYAALEPRAAAFDAVKEARLCHEDLHDSNILFEQQEGEWRLCTILDIDKAWAGPAESDLARLELWRGMTSQDFWAGYRMFRDVPECYPQRRPVYQLLWCLEYARATPQHLADTRQVCEELECPVIDRFD